MAIYSNRRVQYDPAVDSVQKKTQIDGRMTGLYSPVTKAARLNRGTMRGLQVGDGLAVGDIIILDEVESISSICIPQLSIRWLREEAVLGAPFVFAGDLLPKDPTRSMYTKLNDTPAQFKTVEANGAANIRPHWGNWFCWTNQGGGNLNQTTVAGFDMEPEIIADGTPDQTGNEENNMTILHTPGRSRHNKLALMPDAAVNLTTAPRIAACLPSLDRRFYTLRQILEDSYINPKLVDGSTAGAIVDNAGNPIVRIREDGNSVNVSYEKYERVSTWYLCFNVRAALNRAQVDAMDFKVEWTEYTANSGIGSEASIGCYDTNPRG
jgi:hypothetical protein